MSATMTPEEGQALERAMLRSEQDDPEKTPGHEVSADCDRFTSVAQEVLNAVATAHGTEPPSFGPQGRARR
jgi:hypothetical protein